MSSFTGVGVNPGRVLGPARTMAAPVAEPPAGQPWPEGQNEQTEVERLKAAALAVRDGLRQRAEVTSGEGKAVLEATALMANDPMLIKSATTRISAGHNAERAIWEAAEEVAAMLRQLGGYMAERVHDVYDVRSRIVAQLRGVSAPGIPDSEVPFVLLASDLAPADTATLDPHKVLALVTAEGGPQSHTAIIARALGLPAIVAARGSNGQSITEVAGGSEVFVDGAAGVLTTKPRAAERELATAWAKQSAALQVFDGRGRLADDTQIPLLANVGNAAEAEAAAKAGAQGIGLFRTEFLFLDRDEEPSVEEQLVAYRGVFSAFPGRKVVVRTLDAGADKPLPFIANGQGPNPALGLRGYRTELTSPGVLARQLQAIAQAAEQSKAEIWVMAPMISTPAEAAEFTELCHRSGLPSAGVMVEVPAAAISARRLLEQADFASLGTNDLTQYTLAADRQLAPLADFNDPWQPAVLTLIRMTVEGAAAKPVGVCGEAAADPALAVVLAGLGVSTLSMSTRALPAVAAVLRSVSSNMARTLAETVLDASSAAEARARAREGLPILSTLGL